MRTIEELLRRNERVWFYLKDAETKASFVQEINSLGCRYLNGESLDVTTCYHVMAVHSDRRLAQVKIFIWNSSFQGAEFTPFPLRVDYHKLITGAQNWECTASGFETLRSPLSMTEN